MAHKPSNQENGTESLAANSFLTQAPSVSLPKGGGAVRGIGEKFSANPVTGTGSMSVPIATSPGRSGFGPQLSLSYDSGAGNGPFGFGWSLSLPSITRKTDKGLPLYQDTDESDVFILSGAEDLVPEFKKGASPGEWAKDGRGQFIYGEVLRDGYSVRRLRPRIEGLFARIERWASQTDPNDVFWRSISKDNVTTIYGKTSGSRIADPADKSRIFSWLICETYDDKGNAILYGYKAEDADALELSAANERNRNCIAQRYLKSIKYGNKTPLRPSEDLKLRTDWLFEVVFDYGEHSPKPDSPGKLLDNPKPDDPGTWLCRHDPFSSYRAGFEVRTYRLCQRVLMFHHFPDEDIGSNCLVKSTDFAYLDSRGNPEARKKGNPIASFIDAVTQTGYERNPTGGYCTRSLPPLEFEYSEAKIQDTIREVDAASLENLPVGLDGVGYQWIDLDGVGISGILSEQADAWFYKRNLSPITTTEEDGVTRNVAAFAPMQRVAEKPAYAEIGAGGWQIQDLGGDGKPDLARFAGPVSGFFERNDEGKWENFLPFRALPNVNWRDPNLRFVDLTGDGLADILITEDQAFTWYLSLGETGFAPSRRVQQALDEERGPRLVFADGEQSIYLADFSGDGLTDLVRIRNGEVCYWPNLGYGRFGAKVTMDDAPRFDAPDQFSQQRIRLADVDGSGLTDILYLGRNGITVYFNQAGNSWGSGQRIEQVPRVDNLAAVQVVDLFGNGTACLVWSSPLPADARRPMRYIDLMGGQKPHLLIKARNNLGGETRIQYAASTKFYLQDSAAGKPWITKLPFPVHVVEKVTTKDKWRQTEFITSYSYHHGYFDGVEREFRGFGRVEQNDVESYGPFQQGNVSPYITDNQDLYQPPVKTITWYHTGAAFDRDRILSAFKQEYFTIPGFAEHQLPEPTLSPGDLSADEWREAARACKGMVLRQEVFELDVDALGRGEELFVRLFTSAYHNSDIRCLQPRGSNRHAVFLVAESEAITCHHELDLRSLAPTPDPRITHTLNLSFDNYGRSLQSVAVVYPRQVPYSEPANTPPNPLDPHQLALIHAVQRERHIAYTETRYTAELPEHPDRHRLPATCEVLTYELTGADSALGFAPSLAPYFTVDDMKAFALSDLLPDQGTRQVTKLEYHEQASDDSAHQRIVEWLRMRYFKDDLSGPEDFGKNAWLGLLYETYKLALTDELLNAVFKQTNATGVVDDKLAWEVKPGITARDLLDEPASAGLPYLKSGYIQGSAIDHALSGQYWMRSGITGFASDAKDHFYLPEDYTDPFDNKTTLQYDGNYDLFIQSSTDAMRNTIAVAKDPVTKKPRFDYRVLAPIEMVDVNGNHSEVRVDILGRVIATAVKGKNLSITTTAAWEGDNLDSFTDALADPPPADVVGFCTDTTLQEQHARDWLDNASTRFLYHFGDQNGQWEQRMAGACGIVREQHVGKLAAGTVSPLQVALECSDGSGNVLMKKVQAEPERVGGPLRWIVNGLTVLNNKGKPVKQYEPDFSDRFGCEPPQANGVATVMYYDAIGRLIRTEMPDGTFSKVEFSPWHVTTFDANDTVLESRWYSDRTPVPPDRPLPRDLITQALTVTPDQRAAWLAAQHANTPAQVHLDSLGREVISIAQNRVIDGAGAWLDEKYLTFTKMDTEGKPLWIRDALGHLVMQYIAPPKDNNDQSNAMPSGSIPCYDIAANLLFQHSMDAGDRWLLNDAAGKPMLAWDMNETVQGSPTHQENRLYSTVYDALHRPKALWLAIKNAPRIMVERYEYQDAASPDTNNLNGQLIQHYDPSGCLETIHRDFKGNVQEVHRTLNNLPEESVIDWQANPANKLNDETYVQITEHDALNRMARMVNWHLPSQKRIAIYLPRYNQRGSLAGEDLVMRATGYNPSTGTPTSVIRKIEYNAKGQKTCLKLGNGTVTCYAYDPYTFRLIQLRTTRPNYDPPFPGTHANLADPKVLQQINYTYDPAGNITEIYDEAYERTFFANAKVEPRSIYEYDALYRLTKATGRENGAAAGTPRQIEGNAPEVNFPDPSALRSYTQIYTYDAVGNFKCMDHQAGQQGSWKRHYAYAFDDPAQMASNRLWKTWTGRAAANVVTYGYDSHGNMLNLASTDPRFDLQWDHRDMIRRIDLGGGGMAYYQYDTGKQRTRKRIVNQNGLGGYWERIDLGGYERYRRYNGNGSALVEEIESHHLFEGKQRVLLVDDVVAASDTAHLRRDSPTVKAQILFRYQYSNHLGSVGLELDDQAEIISYEEYHPYGTSAYRAIKKGIEAPPNRYRYTGKERDGETGLYYHGARYYAPCLGKWTSCDPAGTEGGTEVYCYVLNNPICFHDPDGKDPAPYEIADLMAVLPNSKGEKVSKVASDLGGTVGDAIVATEPDLRGVLKATLVETLFDVGGGVVGALVDPPSVIRSFMRVGIGTGQGVEDYQAGNKVLGTSRIVGEVFQVAGAALGGVAVARTLGVPGTFQPPTATAVPGPTPTPEPSVPPAPAAPSPAAPAPTPAPTIRPPMAPAPKPAAPAPAPTPAPTIRPPMAPAPKPAPAPAPKPAPAPAPKPAPASRTPEEIRKGVGPAANPEPPNAAKPGPYVVKLLPKQTGTNRSGWETNLGRVNNKKP